MKAILFTPIRALLKVQQAVLATFLSILIFLLGGGGGGSLLRAQEPSPSLQEFTPNAAELGRYGRVPVSYSSGLPDITIPLTELRAKGFTLPVSLSYHGGGFTTETHPGWTGLGWSLRAGGCINRIVRGAKDELDKEEYSARNSGSGDHYGVPSFNPGFLWGTDWFGAQDWSDTLRLASLISQPLADGQWMRDLEPDEFIVSAGDISASFSVTSFNAQTGKCEVTIVSQEGGTFRVEMDVVTDGEAHATYPVFTSADGSATLNAFMFTYIRGITLIRDDGVRYVFGGDAASIEPSFMKKGSGAGAFLIGTVNTWHLTRIILPGGEEVELSYLKDGAPVIVSDVHHAEMYVPGSGLGYVGDDTKLGPSGQSVSCTVTRPAYLNRIRSKSTGREISFHASRSTELTYGMTSLLYSTKIGTFSAGTHAFSIAELMGQDYFLQLDSIVAPDRRIVFSYNDNPSRRLRLESLTIRGGGEGEGGNSGTGADDERYTMSYDPTYLPSYNSRESDRWGYYNGISYSGVEYEDLESVRKGVASKMKAEMLSSITWPTGGRTEFGWEPHAFAYVSEPYAGQPVHKQAGTGGGLRIATITDVTRAPAGGGEGADANGEVRSVRRFTYGDGTMAGYPVFWATGKWWQNGYHASGWSGLQHWYISAVGTQLSYYMGSERHVNTLPADAGVPVTYSWVREYGPEGGCTLMRYSGHSDVPDLLPETIWGNVENVSITQPFTPMALGRGLLLSREMYDASGRLLFREENSYAQEANASDTAPFYGGVHRDFLFGDLLRCSFIRYPSYYPSLLMRVVTEYPDEGMPTERTTVFSYNSRRLPSGSITYTSGVGGSGSTSAGNPFREETTVRYSGDVTGGPEGDVWHAMAEAGMTALPVETRHLRGGMVIGGELRLYKRNPAAAAASASSAGSGAGGHVSGAPATLEQILSGGDSVYPVEDTCRYSLSVYEDSPRGRMTASFGPGSEWQTGDHGVKVSSATNSATSGSAYLCRQWTLQWTGTSPSIVLQAAPYPAGTIQVQRTADEDGRVTLEFTDPFGQTVLRRKFTAMGITGTTVDTYFVHDSMGRLVAVLQPEFVKKALAAEASASSSSSTTFPFAEISPLAWVYRYDSDGLSPSRGERHGVASGIALMAGTVRGLCPLGHLTFQSLAS